MGAKRKPVALPSFSLIGMDATSWRLAKAVQTADMIEQVISEDVLGAERQVLTRIGPETIKARHAPRVQPPTSPLETPTMRPP